MMNKTIDKILKIVITMLVFLMAFSGCGGGVNEADDSGGINPLPEMSFFKLPTFNHATATPPVPTVVNFSEKLDDAGVLLEDLTVVSGDGKAKIFFAKGTKLVDSNQEPVDLITINMGYYSEHLEENRLLWGYIYDFLPQDVEITPSALLTLAYDPPLLEADKDENDPLLGKLDTGSNQWVWLEGDIDLSKFCVSTEINELGCFSISLGIIYEPPLS